MILRIVCAAALALASAPARSPLPQDAIEAALRRHVTVLADDAMEGRRPGTPGGDKAVQYIAAEMLAAGLRPGANGDSWYQPVDLIERKARSAEIVWRLGRQIFDLPEDQFVLLGRSPALRLKRARLIFGGYGYPENLAGAELAGAVVLLLPGKPENRSDAPSLDERRDALVKRGAAAILSLMASNMSWQGVQSQYRNGRTSLAEDSAPAISGALSYALWAALLRKADQDPKRLEASAADASFRAVPLPGEADLRARTAIRAYSSVNVIGRLPGTTRPDEAVVITAHWDHLGICRGRSVSDRICNGAVDNASGVASMLEVARGLANGPSSPRTLLFVATTAEELGLLGARALARHPPAKLVAGLNLDTVAIAPRGQPIAVIGRGLTPLDPLIDDTARALGRKVDTGTDANAYVTRQDGWALMSAGVPAVMAGGAFNDMALLQRFFASRYHGPADDLAHDIELGGAAEDVTFHVALARRLADPSLFPAPVR